MPTVEKWWNDELKRYDDKLEIVWKSHLNRFAVIRHNKKSTETLLIVEDKNGGFLTPHPNLIIWGDKDLGFQGINEVDFYKSGHKYVSSFVDECNYKQDKIKSYKRKKYKEYIGDRASELYWSSAMRPRVSFANAPFKGRKG